MARNNMNFSASLRLNAKQFKQGIADVQRTLNSLKSAFLSFSAALGAGLGLNKIISSAKDTAQQLSVAKAVLKNVSQEVDEAGYKWDSYASNLEYVKKLSKEYGQDLTNLIEGFGQFHAAANLVLDANGKVALSLEDQKYIYEQLTRAAAGYHMSADRTKDMMNAITQMMSKGKIAAEELRRQLGNALPGAFGLMATAMGKTTMELEDMMRKGQLLSSEALLPFAKELEKITQEMSFDSLQQSLNRLKNSWTELVDKSDVEGMYKKIVDASNGLLQWISNHMSGVKGTITGTLAGIVAYFTSNVVLKMINGIKKLRAEWITTFDEANQRVAALYEGAKKIEGIKTNGPEGPMELGDMALTEENIDKLKSALKYADEYNQELLKLDKAYKALQGKGILREGDKKLIKEISKTYRDIATTGTVVNNSATVWERALGGVKRIWYQIWGAIKGIAISMAAMAIVGVIVGLISKWAEKQKEVKKYAEETARIYSDYEADLKKIDEMDGENIIKLNQQKRILRECEQGSAEWAGAVAEINQKLGLQGDQMFTIESKYEDIVAAVDKWIARLKIVSKINRHIAHQQEAEEQMEDVRSQLNAKAKEYEKMTGYGLGGFINITGGDDFGKYNQSQLNKGNIKRKNWIEKEVRPLINRIKELQRVSTDADAAINELTKDLYKNYGTTTTGDFIPTSGDTDDKKVSDIRKVFDNWTKESKELSNKLREHAITQEEYNEEYDKLVKKFFENAAETGKYSIDAILAKADKGQTLTAMEKWYKMLYDSAGEAAQRILVREAQDAIEKSLDDAINEMDDVLQREMEEWLEQTEKTLKSDTEALLTEMPKLGSRDTAFDYKKSQSEKSSEQLDTTRDNISAMEDYIDGIVGSYDKWEDACDAVKDKIAQARVMLAKMKQEASTLEQVVKIQQIDEDIKKLGEDLNKAWGDGIKNVAQGTDRVVKGLQSMAEAFGDEIDLEGWNKFMSVFNEIIQIVETLISLYNMFNTISEITSTMQDAKNSKQEELNRLLTEEIGLRLMLKKIQDGNLSDTEKQIIKDILAAKAAKTKQAAKSGEAVAGATAAGAELPFPYNLAAIAAGVAEVLAALASASKFASGGIVGGNSYKGDNVLSRTNSGEMILNKAQQGTLWNMLNGKGGVGNNVQFKIRGADLIGVMNNEMSRRRG